MKKSLWAFALVLAVATPVACSTSSPDGDAPPASVGAAIGAIFSGGNSEPAGEGAQESPEGSDSALYSNTCSEFQSEFEDEHAGPEGVISLPTITAGSYGPDSALATVGEDDSCDADPTNPDSYASFSITAAVTATCTDGSSVSLMPGSSGIWRNNGVYFPEISGTFNVQDGDGTEYNDILCQIQLLEDETIASAVCEDSSGTALDTSSDVDCQFNTTE